MQRIRSIQAQATLGAGIGGLALGRYLPILLTIPFFLVGILFCACKTGTDDAAKPDRRSAWTEQLGALRPLEGRLVGVAYASYQRGQALDSRKAGRARRALARLSARFPSPEALAAKAFLKLLSSDLEGAVVALQAAAVRDPLRSACQSDLAAIRLEQAEQQRRPYFLVLAFGLADVAWRTDPGLLPAGFNRALALEKLFLRRAALAAWQEYLVREPDTAFRAEAEQHVRQLSVPGSAERWAEAQARLSRAVARGDSVEAGAIVGRFPQEAREWAQGDLLPTWARARQSGSTAEAEQGLRRSAQRWRPRQGRLSWTRRSRRSIALRPTYRF
jgi:hypothetical protein